MRNRHGNDEDAQYDGLCKAEQVAGSADQQQGNQIDVDARDQACNDACQTAEKDSGQYLQKHQVTRISSARISGLFPYSSTLPMISTCAPLERFKGVSLKTTMSISWGWVTLRKTAFSVWVMPVTCPFILT